MIKLFSLIINQMHTTNTHYKHCNIGNRRLSLTAIVACLLLILSCQTSYALSQNISLQLNKGKIIRVYRQTDTVFIANPEIANFHLKAPGVLYIYSKKIGETNLFVMNKRGQVTAKYHIQVVVDISGLKRALYALFPNEQIQVKAVGDSVALKGLVATASKANAIIKVANRFVPDKSKIINLIKIGLPTQVNLRVRVVEMQRETERIIGLNWNAIYGPASTLLGVGSSFPLRAATERNFFLTADILRGNLDLTATVDLLDQEGLVTILSEPNLTAMSGATATFLAGGEFPIIVPQGGLNNSNTIEFKKFGVQLAFTPVLLNSKLINLHVRPEVSELTDKGAVELSGIKVPALVTRRAETTVELNSGQSFVIAGLLQNNAKNLVSKFPGLGDIPLFGRLFRSHEFLRGESELVIIVTPYIVNPTDGNELALPTDELRTAQTIVRKLKYNGKIGFILE